MPPNWGSLSSHDLIDAPGYDVIARMNPDLAMDTNFDDLPLL